MKNQALVRLSRVLFAFFAGFVLWAIISLLRGPFDVTSYWGVGLAFSLFMLLVITFSSLIYGVGRSALAAVVSLVLVFGMLTLNAFRGWPFGMVVYNDILGWQVGRVAWPIPIFWTALILFVLLVMRPKEPGSDPKSIFTWSFDTAIVTMFFSLLIEPLAYATRASMWAIPGPILGVTVSAFLGWFITSFIVAFSAIITGKLWLMPEKSRTVLLPASLGLLCVLLFAVSLSTGLALVEIISAIGLVIFVTMAIKWRKQRFDI